MKEMLLEAFRHHAWANKQLLAPAAGSSEQLTLPGTAASTDRGIVAILTTSPSPTAVMCRGAATDLTGSRTRRTPPNWASSNGAPAEREVGSGSSRSRSTRQAHHPGPRGLRGEQSVLVVQALHHGNAHRERDLCHSHRPGIQPPDIQGWAYAEATGHARERSPRTGLS